MGLYLNFCGRKRSLHLAGEDRFSCLFFFKKRMVVVGKWTVNSKDLIHIHRKAELKSVHALALLCQKSLEFCHQLCFGEGFTFPLLPGWILLELPRQGPSYPFRLLFRHCQQGFQFFCSSFVPLFFCLFVCFLLSFREYVTRGTEIPISALCGFQKSFSVGIFFPCSEVRRAFCLNLAHPYAFFMRQHCLHYAQQLRFYPVGTEWRSMLCKQPLSFVTIKYLLQASGMLIFYGMIFCWHWAESWTWVGLQHLWSSYQMEGKRNEENVFLDMPFTYETEWYSGLQVKLSGIFLSWIICAAPFFCTTTVSESQFP